MADPNHNPFATKKAYSLQDAAQQRATETRRRSSGARTSDMSKSMTAAQMSSPSSLGSTNSTPQKMNMGSSWHAGPPQQQQQQYAPMPGNSYFGSSPQYVQPPVSPALSDSQQPKTETPPPSQTINRTPSHPQSTSEAIAAAKSQWNQGGGNEGGQILEDRRRALSQRAKPPKPPPQPFPMMSQTLTATVNLENIMASSASLTPSYSTKVTCAEQRVDPAGSAYTAYIVSVISPTGSKLIEHRFSEFHKLSMEIAANNVTLPSPFPPKSMAGRLGNWTPSALIAPQSQQQLINDRIVRLDQWLLGVVEMLQDGKIVNKLLRNEVIEFLEVSAAGRPPCDRANNVNWTSLSDGSSDAASDNGVIIGDGEQKEVHGGGQQKLLANPLSFTLGSEIRKAVYCIGNMCGTSAMSSDRSVPLDLLHQAKGIAFLSVIKGGLIVSARVGTGLVLSRQPDGGWSAPSAIGTVGIGWGAQIGGDITSYLIILNSVSAVNSFSGNGQVTLGTEFDVAVGPIGRGMEGKVGTGGGEWVAPAYSYAHSKGLFAGISIEGSIITCRHDINSKFYGKPVEPNVLLNGGMNRPRAAKILYDALDEALGVQIDGWRPSVALKDAGIVKSEVPVPVPVGAAGGGAVSNPYA
ncbi:hypothetical protein TrVE_jg3571 [Triparma verrucosa]|uniref:PX domain-containing protein n=2 Tax=Triparma TaxID=722752 RepID=A0A9W7A3Y7_9STRA|nr:hypothetical protein TrST_g10132 [Triparma strigata]GMI03679.1 hypothetical protein TrVE_jg3571 [Triparma verrucosa]